MFIFLLLYIGGIALYYSSRHNRRPGIEHGSAKWGSVHELNRKYSDKDDSMNVILTQHLKMSMNGKHHIMCVWTALVLSATVFVTSAFATGSDPLTVVNNFSDFIFSCIKAVGIIILGWGIVQVGMSVQSHDASQRSQGFLCLLGGLIIAFSKEILAAIGVM